MQSASRGASAHTKNSRGARRSAPFGQLFGGLCKDVGSSWCEHVYELDLAATQSLKHA